MPVIKIGPSRPRKYPELAARLVEELRRESDEGTPPVDPYIIEETVNQGPAKHVFVIWDAWRDVPLDDRGGVIMDAYDQFDPGSVKEITLVMGLTFEEAARLKIGPQDVVAKGLK